MRKVRLYVWTGNGIGKVLSDGIGKGLGDGLGKGLSDGLGKGLMLAFLVIIVSTPGCATLFAPATHPLALSTDPPKAEVYVNGFMRGVTPLELNLKADMSYTIEFRKEGYDPVIRIVNTRIGAGWVILDVIGGLLPVVVDAATGAWNELDQDTVNAVLRKQDVQTDPAPADSP